MGAFDRLIYARPGTIASMRPLLTAHGIREVVARIGFALSLRMASASR